MSVRTTLEQRQDRASSRLVRPNLAEKISYGNAKERMYHTGATNGEASPGLHGEARQWHCFELRLGRRAREGVRATAGKEERKRRCAGGPPVAADRGARGLGIPSCGRGGG